MPEKRLLLVNPNRMVPPIAPLGLEFAANALDHAGYAVDICDLSFEADPEAALKKALATSPAAVLASIRNIDDAYFASQAFILETSRGLIQRIRDNTEAPLILGGVGFSMAPKAVLDYTGADYGLAGSNETVLPALLKSVLQGVAPAQVPGAVFRKPSGAITLVPPNLCDLDQLPTPRRRFFDHARYFREGGQAGLETKRGCNGRCIYCPEPSAKGNRVRLRSPESLVEECQDLLAQGIDVIHLCDSEFNRPPDHAQAFCDALIHSGLSKQLRWYAYCSPDFFDRSLAAKMRLAGCVGINFGVDHGDPLMLKNLGRAYGPETVRQTVQACRQEGITVMYDMLLGGPGESRESLATAIDFLRELEVDRAGLSCGIPVYPHTPLARMLQSQGPLAENPHLHGVTEDNDSLLRPIFYVEAALGSAIHSIVTELVAGDTRFLHADPAEVEGNYNYNDNQVLCQAIAQGARGAYWDILRRLEGEEMR